MACDAPVGVGPGAAPGRAGGYGKLAVVVAGAYAGPVRLVVSAGCVVDGLISVALAALVFIGAALWTGTPAMITARVSTSAGCAVFYEVEEMRRVEE